jgi:hypothetical protein
VQLYGELDIHSVGFGMEVEVTGKLLGGGNRPMRWRSAIRPAGARRARS